MRAALGAPLDGGKAEAQTAAAATAANAAAAAAAAAATSATAAGDGAAAAAVPGGRVAAWITPAVGAVRALVWEPYGQPLWTSARSLLPRKRWPLALLTVVLLALLTVQVVQMREVQRLAHVTQARHRQLVQTFPGLVDSDARNAGPAAADIHGGAVGPAAEAALLQARLARWRREWSELESSAEDVLQRFTQLKQHRSDLWHHLDAVLERGGDGLAPAVERARRQTGDRDRNHDPKTDL